MKEMSIVNKQIFSPKRTCTPNLAGYGKAWLLVRFFRKNGTNSLRKQYLEGERTKEKIFINYI